MELIVIIVLAILNLFQLVFWSVQQHKLVDKIMSRNYAEYVQTEQLARSSPKSQTQTIPNDDDLNDPVLNELNGLLGGG